MIVNMTKTSLILSSIQENLTRGKMHSLQTAARLAQLGLSAQLIALTALVKNKTLPRLSLGRVHCWSMKLVSEAGLMNIVSP